MCDQRDSILEIIGLSVELWDNPTVKFTTITFGSGSTARSSSQLLVRVHDPAPYPSGVQSHHCVPHSLRSLVSLSMSFWFTCDQSTYANGDIPVHLGPIWWGTQYRGDHPSDSRSHWTAWSNYVPNAERKNAPFQVCVYLYEYSAQMKQTYSQDIISQTVGSAHQSIRNAPKYQSFTVLNHFTHHEIESLSWKPSSPDLYSIHPAWDQLDCNVHQRWRCATVFQMMTALSRKH